MTPAIKGRTFTINYALGDGAVAGSGAPTSWVYNSADVALKNPTRLGYTFAGWTISGMKDAATITGAGTTSCTIGKKTIPSDGAAITATAKWTENSYTINFSSNGGTGSANPVSMGLKVTDTGKRFAQAGALGGASARVGYHFANWNSKADGTGTDYKTNAVIDAPAFIGANEWVYDSATATYTTTLFVDWDENTYSISFNAGALDGANARIGGTAPARIENVKYNDKIAFPANTFTQQGYTFTAWDTVKGTAGADSAGLWAPTGTGTPSVSVADIIANAKTQSIPNMANDNPITLYANWNASEYTIAYAKGIVTDAVTLPSSSVSGATYTEILAAGAKIAAPLGNTLGYISSGWSLANDKDSDKAQHVTEEAAINADTFANYFNGSAGDETITLTGSWTEKSITVRYDKNASGASYSSGSPVSVTKKYTEAFALPIDVAGDGSGKAAAGIDYAGYNLDGWLASADGTDKISASAMSDIVAAKASASAVDAASIVSSSKPAITIYATYGAGDNSYTIMYSYQSIDDGTYPDSLKVTGVSNSDVATGDKVVIDDVIKGRHTYGGCTYVLESAGSDLGSHEVAGDASKNVWTVKYKLVLTVNYDNANSNKGGWADENGETVTFAEFNWGDKLTLPDAKTVSVPDYRFASWVPSDGAPAVEDGTLVKRDGDTYTATWENVKYIVKYGFYDGVTSAFADLPATHEYTWAQLAAAECDVPAVKAGAKFVDWRDARTAGSSITADTLIKDALFNSGAGSSDGQDMEGTLYLNAAGKTYNVKFWMYGTAAGNPVLGADGQALVKKVTFGGEPVAMPKQSDISDASKLYGYLVAGFGTTKDLYKGLSPDTGDAVTLSAEELIAALGDRGEGGTYSLFATWNAVYKVSVPTSEIAMSIDPTTRDAIVSDREVKVENASPKAVNVGAYAEISASDIEKAKYLFLGTKDASDAALNGVNFVFCDEGKPFAVNGGAASVVSYDSPVGGAVAADGEVTRLSMTGLVKLLLPESIWPSLAASTGGLLSMSDADFAALGLNGVTRSDTSVSWGKIATITWVVSQTATGESFDAETGQGSATYGPFADESAAYE